MTTTTTPNAITKLLQGADLTAESVTQLEAAFQPLLANAEDLVAKSAHIAVTDATQVTEMKQARAARLALKDVRVAVENVRKTLKADSLNRGRLIDAIAKALTAPIEPEEARLEACEKFAERAEAARQEALRKSRTEALAPYAIDSSIYPLGSMKEDAFAQLLEGTRLAHEAKIEAARKAEEDRVAREKAEAEERARIKAENDRLRAEKEAADRAAQAEREKAAKERAEAEEAARKERLRLQAIADAERQKAAEELCKANEAREAAEAKIKADAAAKAKAEADAACAAKKAAAAPDADKLMALARAFRAVAIPDVTTAEAKAVMVLIRDWQGKLAARIEQEASKL